MVGGGDQNSKFPPNTKCVMSFVRDCSYAKLECTVPRSLRERRLESVEHDRTKIVDTGMNDEKTLMVPFGLSSTTRHCGLPEAE